MTSSSRPRCPSPSAASPRSARPGTPSSSGCSPRTSPSVGGNRLGRGHQPLSEEFVVPQGRLMVGSGELARPARPDSRRPASRPASVSFAPDARVLAGTGTTGTPTSSRRAPGRRTGRARSPASRRPCASPTAGSCSRGRTSPWAGRASWMEPSKAARPPRRRSPTWSDTSVGRSSIESDQNFRPSADIGDGPVRLAAELIAAASPNPPGDERAAADVAGSGTARPRNHDVEVTGPAPERPNVIARIPGRGGGPIPDLERAHRHQAAGRARGLGAAAVGAGGRDGHLHGLGRPT